MTEFTVSENVCVNLTFDTIESIPFKNEKCVEHLLSSYLNQYMYIKNTILRNKSVVNVVLKPQMRCHTVNLCMR